MISLSLLRVHAQAADARQCAGCNCTHRYAACPNRQLKVQGAEVLALVEAVQAAQAFRRVLKATDWDEAKAIAQRLDAALEPFTAEDGDAA